MNNLRDILYGVSLEEVRGNTDFEVNNLRFDSRLVESGDVFFAINGVSVNGNAYIPKAIENGAAVVITEDKFSGDIGDVIFIRVKNARHALAVMAANYYDHPSKDLKLVGITGTNGKTSVATMSYELFKSLGYKVGLISTIQNIIHETKIEATHTTPDPVSINKMLAEMAAAGCEFVFMEVSSHAIDQDRIMNLHFAGAVFTNITHDHLDYHKTFPAYINAKKRLFDSLPKSSFGLVNVDDKRGMVMLQNSNAKQYSFALKAKADFRLRILENSFAGLIMQIGSHEVHSQMVGEFNAYNILTVYAIAILLDQDEMESLSAISALKGAKGRFQYVLSPKDGIRAIVDYAHTPDALKNVLQTINEIRGGEGQLITLIGCGGNRDKEKRPLMAKIATTYSDKVILTSDNPRNENPSDIIEDMRKGVSPLKVKNVMVVEDRREAIKIACTLAKGNDVLLVAGKGHEDYQEINGVKSHFDDKEILEETFKILAI